jgi:Rps23 Pro-64 3,4-dihydroxylase Tpa1-like proline 4-hydroxylase
MDYEILDLGLVYYKNVIPSSKSIVDMVESLDKRFMANEHQGAETIVAEWNPWTYGELLFNLQKFFPESQDVPENDYYAKEMKTIADGIYTPLKLALDHYTNEIYPLAAKNIKSREHTMHLLKYGVGGHLPAHQDQGVSSRVLSTVMYLNDDYSGGEIEFRQSNVKIKPESGSIIFFPSNFLYVHEVYPITSGFRYSMPLWFHNVENLVQSTGAE